MNQFSTIPAVEAAIWLVISAAVCFFVLVLAVRALIADRDARLFAMVFISSFWVGFFPAKWILKLTFDGAMMVSWIIFVPAFFALVVWDKHDRKRRWERGQL